MACFDQQDVFKKAFAAAVIAFAASAYSPASLCAGQQPEKSVETPGQSKWEVQGNIAGKVVIVNGRGDTTVVDAGSEIDGCLVTSEKVICGAPKKTSEDSRPAGGNLISLLEAEGREGFSPELGQIKYAQSGGKLIIRVAGTFYDKAETALKEAVLEKIRDKEFVYYALDGEIVDLECK